VKLSWVKLVSLKLVICIQCLKHGYIESLENAYSLTMSDINRPATGLPLAAQQSERQQEHLYMNNNK
jgi:hypothetical protein